MITVVNIFPAAIVFHQSTGKSMALMRLQMLVLSPLADWKRSVAQQESHLNPLCVLSVCL